MSIGIWVFAAQHVPPEQRVVQSNGTANAHKAEEAKQSEQATANEAARKQEVDAQKLKEAEEQKQEEMAIEWKIVKYTRWLVIVGAIQFLALIVQAVMFFLTLRQMRDSSQRQLRAYVCLDSGMLAFEENAFEAQVHMRNCGQTPAYKVRQWMHVWIESYPLQVTLPEPTQDFPMSVAVLPPDGEHIMAREPGIQPPAPAVTLGGPHRTVYVYGKVSYRDIFGKEQRTEYRLVFGGADGGRKKINDDGQLIGLLQPDSEGNEAT